MRLKLQTSNSKQFKVQSFGMRQKRGLILLEDTAVIQLAESRCKLGWISEFLMFWAPSRQLLWMASLGRGSRSVLWSVTALLCSIVLTVFLVPSLPQRDLISLLSKDGVLIYPLTLGWFKDFFNQYGVVEITTRDIQNLWKDSFHFVYWGHQLLYVISDYAETTIVWWTVRHTSHEGKA